MTMLTELRESYAAAFDAYLAAPGERALQSAYELGREAVARELSVLDLATTHHDVVRAALAGTSGAADAQRVGDAAAEFFLESLSAFEMLQRGFRETQEAALAEQRQAAMLRRLSTFLGDASLAFEEAESIEEMLQLVAEQARELIGAECCFAFASLAESRVDAIATANVESVWNDITDRSTLYKLATLLTSRTGVTRLGEQELSDDPAAIALGGLVGRPVRAFVAAQLTALDGRKLGSIHLVDPQRTAFGDVDEAQLLHLTQLASSAIERAMLYGRERRVAAALERARHDAADASAPDVAVRQRASAAGGAVWLDVVSLDEARLLLVAGEVRGPAAAVAAAQARAAARALADRPPRELIHMLSTLLEAVAPDNPARSAAVLVDGDRAETAVDGVGEATVALGGGAAVVLHVGGGVPPAVAVEGGGVEVAADRVLGRLDTGAEGEAAVLAAARRIVRPHP